MKMRSTLLVLVLFFLFSLALSAAKVTIVPPNNGTIVAVDAHGKRYQPSATAYTIAPGTVLTLSATPASDCYSFSSWSCVGGQVQNNTLTVGESDLTVRALFLVHQHTITADVQPAETGTVKMQLGLGEIFINLSGPVNCGVMVRLTAMDVENTGYHFLRWDDGSTNPVRDVVVDEDANYTAFFDNGEDKVSSINDADISVYPSCRKYLQDGQLILEYNQTKYTVQGAIIY